MCMYIYIYIYFMLHISADPCVSMGERAKEGRFVCYSFDLSIATFVVVVCRALKGWGKERWSIFL